MVLCPHCQNEFETDDFGVVECPSCKASLLLDMSGNLQNDSEESPPETKVATSPSESEAPSSPQEEEPQEEEPQEEVENPEEFQEEAQVEEFQTEEPQEEEPQEEEPQEEEPQEEESQEEEPQEEAKEVQEDVSAQQEGESPGDDEEKWEKSFQDALEGEGTFLEESSSQEDKREEVKEISFQEEEGVDRTLHITVKGVYSEKQRESVMKILRDERISLNVEINLDSLPDGKLDIPNIPMAKGVFLVKELCHIGFDVSWTS